MKLRQSLVQGCHFSMPLHPCDRRLFRNHSHEEPEGVLSKNDPLECDGKTDKRIAKEIVRAFFAIYRGKET